MRALGKGSVASIAKIGLTVAWWALWLALGALLVAALGYAALLGLIQAGFPEPAWFAELLAPTDDNPAGFIWPVAAPTFLIGSVTVGGGLVVVDRLRKLFDGFSSGEPFRRDNGDHMRMIWVAMFLVEVARIALTALMGALLAIFGPARGVSLKQIEPNIDLSTWMSILILIVLAEVFREGARLKEEQELTI